MKKLILSAAILMGCMAYKSASAQVHVSLGINIGSQPEWGPVGYDHVDYYYIPDVNAYYDVNAHQYVYYRHNVWVHGAYLPGPYRNYDMYRGYKVVVNRPTPWVHNNEYKARYAQYRGRHDQVIIRDSHDAKYASHWHDNGRHNGHHDGDDKHKHGR